MKSKAYAPDPAWLNRVGEDSFSGPRCSDGQVMDVVPDPENIAERIDNRGGHISFAANAGTIVRCCSEVQQSLKARLQIVHGPVEDGSGRAGCRQIRRECTVDDSEFGLEVPDPKFDITTFAFEIWLDAEQFGADRLVATLLLMQTRGKVTAIDVATELEVSVATACRDLVALSTAGIPVYSQPGRGGGWSLVGGARTDLTGLTAPESEALFLLLGPMTTAGPEVKTALRKLFRALPDTFRCDAQAAADAVMIDPARWGQLAATPPDLVRTLHSAVVARRRVEIDYLAANKPPSRRTVDPWGLIDKDETWYLIAGTDKGRRTFRVDRIVSVAVTGVVADRPAGFDLAQAWDEVVELVEQRRSLVSATVRVEHRYVRVLGDQFGRHPTVVTTDSQMTLLQVAAPTALMIAQHLAGWGSSVEVIESDAVKAELARLGAELVTAYGPGRIVEPDVHIRFEVP